MLTDALRLTAAVCLVAGCSSGTKHCAAPPGARRRPATPTRVDYASASHGTFVNTGLRTLGRYDLLFDADGGYLGLRVR